MNGINVFQWGQLINALDKQCEYFETIAEQLQELTEELHNINDKLDNQDK